MLKKTITFEDYNGEEVTEDFYFNMSKAELMELQVSEKDGFAETLQKIVQSQDGEQIIGSFKKIILLAVGKKSEDGRRFIKNDEVTNDFAQTNAFSELFMELATNAESAAAFVRGIVPAGMGDEVKANDVQLPASDGEAKDIKTDEEILAMKPQDMTREELQRAFALKNK